MHGTHLIFTAIAFASSTICFDRPESEPVAARVGLYIGIDQYPGLEGSDLGGCVNDVRSLEALFRERFGFDHSTVLVNDQATRDGIGAAMRSTAKAVAELVSSGASPVTALVVYAGHGHQVQDQEGVGSDEPDGLDETWVAHDSDWTGHKDVRDDEVEAFLALLNELGAEVVLVSDSCHSGTIHRGADWARARSPRGLNVKKRKRTGPPTPLLSQEFCDELLESTESSPGDGWVVFAAAADSQQAYEHFDEDGRSCGRLAFCLRKILPQLKADASYAEIQRRIVAEFLQRWPDGLQRPQFHATAAKRGERFLGGGYPEPVARIVPASLRRGTARLDQGLIHGVEKGSRFLFFASTEEAMKGGEPLSTATVESVDLASSLVRFEGETKPELTWAGMLERVEMLSLRVFADPELQNSAADLLKELDGKGVIQLVAPNTGYDLSVASREDGTVLLRCAAPITGAGDASDPTILRELSAEDATRESLTDEIGYLARVRRVATLARNDGELRLELVARTLTVEDSVQRVQAGDDMELRVVNPTPWKLYAHVLVLVPEMARGGNDSAITLLAPLRGEELLPIAPGKSLTIAGLQASANMPVERTTFKVIGSTTPLDLYPLTTAPGARRNRPRGAQGSDPLFDLISAAADGSRQTRGVVLRSRGSYWATSSLVFDVAKR